MIAVIGINHYAGWPRLANAVSDARAAARLFTSLGFEQITAPLFDDAATGNALRHLVADELAQLSPDDRLVVFFAGHGHTHTADFGDTTVKTGCVIPVDGARTRDHVSASWLRLDAWLSDIARLPPRHILVLIDACHSGVALAAQYKWRDEGPEPTTELAALQARRSRRVITSALDDQRATDGGPYPGHSLFTGCLIEAFSGGLAEGGRRVATGRELGLYLQRRVRSYPSSTQTPDFGTFELDDRGDLVVPTLADRAGTDAMTLRAIEPVTATKPAAGAGAPVSGSRQHTRIGRRVTIGIAAGALVAVLALVITVGSEGNQRATPGATNGGSGRNPTIAAAPAELAVDARMPNALDAGLRSPESGPTDATAGPIDAGDATQLSVASPAHPKPPVLVVHCWILGRNLDRPDLDAGENLTMQCVVDNSGTGAANVELETSLAGPIAAPAQHIPRGEHALFEVPIAIPRALAIDSEVEINVVARDRQFARSANTRIVGVIRKPRLCAAGQLTHTQYRAKLAELRAALAAGNLTQDPFDRYDAELVSCLNDAP